VACLRRLTALQCTGKLRSNIVAPAPVADLKTAFLLNLTANTQEQAAVHPKQEVLHDSISSISCKRAARAYAQHEQDLWEEGYNDAQADQ